MDRAQYYNYFLETGVPTTSVDNAKFFISDQFGFDRAFINIKDKGIGYPLFKDNDNNYITFFVKGIEYTCINGNLDILNREKVR